MKKISLFILLLCSTFIFAQIINIPDAKFKVKLLQSSPSNSIAKDLNGNYFKIDANGNGEIEVSEAESFVELNLDNSYIEKLQGID